MVNNEDNDYSDYFSGKKLFGDDFSKEEIEKWNREEADAYADLGNRVNNELENINLFNNYWYKNMNNIHGFNKIKDFKKLTFDNVLGFGSAQGGEFGSIINKINNITIIEPSDDLMSKKIGHIIPKYIKPNKDNSFLIDNDSFDLIICFSALHHIPNVSFVLEELIRVLKPNGYLLVREPIVSMGDWRKPREYLTKNERGIPVSYFDSIFSKNNVDIISKDYCFTATYTIQKMFNILFKSKRPLYSYTFYVFIDKISLIF